MRNIRLNRVECDSFQYYRDVKLAWIFQSMQTMKINHVNYESIFGENLLTTYEHVWDELILKKWLIVTDTDIQFIGDGQYYIPMLQSLIASVRLSEIRGTKKLSVKEIPALIEAVE